MRAETKNCKILQQPQPQTPQHHAPALATPPSTARCLPCQSSYHNSILLGTRETNVCHNSCHSACQQPLLAADLPTCLGKGSPSVIHKAKRLAMCSTHPRHSSRRNVSKQLFESSCRKPCHSFMFLKMKPSQKKPATNQPQMRQ